MFRCLRLCKTGGASWCHLSGCAKNAVGNCLLSGVGSQWPLFLLTYVFQPQLWLSPRKALGRISVALDPSPSRDDGERGRPQIQTVYGRLLDATKVVVKGSG
jgi:hypothetical protein